MIKTYDEFFDETFYKEKLDNGLEVIIFHKPAFLTTSCAFGTKYGALNIAQKLEDKEYSFNPGVAHFLEHKLFETEDKNIFATFSNMGCSVNAFTSYHETVYYFQTTSKNISDPLNLLLDFVQDLALTDENVEKEKGIIIEELSMYLQNADNRLVDETYKSLYHEYPLKYDVGGDEESVKAISRKELEECYKLNYHPSNMVLAISSPIDPEILIEIVRNNQKTKNFKDRVKPVSNNKPEPEEVVRKEFSFTMDVSKPKHLYAIKLKPDFKDSKDAAFKEMCMSIYFKAYFTPYNPNYQKWLDEGLINDYFGYEVDFAKDYAYLMFYEESENDTIVKLVLDELKKDLLSEELLTQIKRNLIGQAFEVFNDIENFNIGFIRDYLNGLDYIDNIEIINSITLEDIKRVYHSFDYRNTALIHIEKSGK